ncbi:murein L,D-transpeptidase catalytic domain family protein [Flavobacteriaceae bacterium F08102]|nr:murein L,D-transpeptidase catalytic domain family protein [Flavobacteriaceae bacterium F08102]
MKKSVLVFLVSLFVYTSGFAGFSTRSFAKNPVHPSKSFISFSVDFYKKLDDKSLDFDAFKFALKGFVKLQTENNLNNSKYLTIIDMSLSSNEERFFLINMDTQQIVYKSLVAHGQNSGGEYAHKFSNRINSHQSSIGFYKTAETYFGKHGLSMRLDGLEYTNSNARARAVVIHQADYVGKDYIEKNGRLGRSYGCPSLPEKDYKEIIARIKNGSCLFIYYPEDHYLANSTFLNAELNV